MTQSQRLERAEVLVDVFLEAGWTVPSDVRDPHGDVWFIAYSPKDHDIAQIAVERNGVISVLGLNPPTSSKKAAVSVLRAAGLEDWLATHETL
jgi:hypothetical protein